MQSRRYCFTINNYNDEEVLAIERLEVSPTALVCYIVVGREIAPNTGTPHLQGYIEFKQRIRPKGIIRDCPYLRRASLQMAKGTAEANQVYCRKDGNVLREAGVPINPGQRSDLQAIQRRLDDGVPLVEIARDDFATWCKYRRSFDHYQMLTEKKERRIDLRVSVYYGSPGTGKTRKVHDEEQSLYCYPGSGMWFDGYGGEECVLFDDYDPTQLPFEYLLKLTDIYPMQVPIKGGFVWFKPKRIIFTSNVSPESWYPEKDFAALKRRIHCTLHFN